MNSPRIQSAAVFGASGGIGGALVTALLAKADVERVYAVARHTIDAIDTRVRPLTFDLTDPASIADTGKQIGADGPIDLCIVATGELVAPEKSWSAQSADAYARAFAINATGPALIGKAMLPLLARDRRSVFAALSARVGSISDNRLGGWHAYRASKAALNMIVRNFAVELAMRNREAIAVTLHPGTVETALATPFAGKRAMESPAVAAAQLLHVLDALTPADSGGLFAYDGQRIAF